MKWQFVYCTQLINQPYSINHSSCRTAQSSIETYFGIVLKLGTPSCKSIAVPVTLLYLEKPKRALDILYKQKPVYWQQKHENFPKVQYHEN